MKTYFAVGKYRKLEEASEITYKYAILHPIRTFPMFHDIVYMESGTWDIFCGDEHFDVFEGDVFILPAGISHKSKCECKAGTTNYYLHMAPVIGDNIGGEPPQNDGITRLAISTVIHCQNNMMVRSLFEEITQLYYSTKPERDDVISALLQTLLFTLYQCDNSVSSKKDDIVNKCLDIMKESPNVLFKELEMAKLLYVSDKTLRAEFVNKFGKTFYQYQMDTKLGQAGIYLIEYPTMKLSEIADLLGFCDEFHLSKVFKKKYGVSPIQYRKNRK